MSNCLNNEGVIFGTHQNANMKKLRLLIDDITVGGIPNLSEIRERIPSKWRDLITIGYVVLDLML